MSSLQDNIKRLTEEKNRMEEEANVLFDKAGDVDKKIEALKRNEILKNNMLNDTKWKLFIKNNVSPTSINRSTFYLIAEGEYEPKRVIDLCMKYYHDYFFVGQSNKEYVEIRVDVGQVALGFSSDKIAMDFIGDQKLDVDVSVCKEELKHLKTSVSIYENLLREFSNGRRTKSGCSEKW